MGDSFSGNLDLENLLIPSQLSLNDERNNSLAVSDYLIKNSDLNGVDITDYPTTLEITTEELFEYEQIDIPKKSKEDLFNILNSKSIKVNPQLFFPKIKHINNLFWFLYNVSNRNLKNTKVLFNTHNEFSELSHKVIDSSVFFGFFTYAHEKNEVYLLPTDDFMHFSSGSLEEKYIILLENIGADKTTRDCINIQLEYTIYDRLCKSMVFDRLKSNHNIIEEKLSNKEITEIVNNVRYWYLDIRKYLLQ